MKTITIQISNTDDRLTQAKWSEFVKEIQNSVSKYATVHFFGTSAGEAAWQHAAWVLVCEPPGYEHLLADIKRIRQLFLQKSVAWTEGETVFV
jgi:hypothetical protein